MYNKKVLISGIEWDASEIEKQNLPALMVLPVEETTLRKETAWQEIKNVLEEAYYYRIRNYRYQSM